jgi:beta-phosphoglucomutase-like phosphatase (HAD superfamily)
MNDLEAILFDLDGVIIDSEPLHEKAFRQTSLHLGRDLTQEEVASLKGTVEEIGAAKLLEYNPAATLSVPQVMEYHNNLYKAMFDQMRLIPGSREFIQKAYKKASNWDLPHQLCKKISSVYLRCLICGRFSLRSLPARTL